MKTCLYDDCPNTGDTPGVEFHEVFDSSEGNKTLGLFICSHHLNQECVKHQEPDQPSQKVPDEPKVAGNGNREGSSVQPASTSLVQKPSRDKQPPDGSASSSEKPKKNRICCAAGCGVSLLSHPDVGLFKFYPSQKRFEKWCLVADLSIRETRLAFCLCARHFHSDSFVDAERRNLKASSNPMYPTGPLNKVTGNYCPIIYTKKEPPLRTQDTGDPISLDDDDDDDDGNNNGEQAESKKPEGQRAPQSTSNNPADSGNLVGNAEGVSHFKRCSHRRCHNTSESNKKVRFFKFPAHPDPRADFWIKAAGLPKGFLHKKVHWLCADHFDSSQFENKFKLKSTAMPMFSGESQPQISFRGIKLMKCDAIGCPVTNRTDPSAKFIGLRNKDSDLFNKWKAMVGGVVERRSSLDYFTLCQYHFPEKSFADAPYRTRLARMKGNTLFPFGPINPKTGDYCPPGKEDQSIMYHKERVLACCIKGCRNFSPLFKFPYYDDKAFDIWCERIGVCRLRYSKEYITNILAVCSIHFDTRCKVLDTKTHSVLLTYGALPTLKLPNFPGGDGGKKTTILKRDADEIPPNAEELAHSLLIKKDEGVRPKRILADIDEYIAIPEKKFKAQPDADADAVVTFDEPPPMVEVVMPYDDPIEPTKKRKVTHWAPLTLLGPDLAPKKVLEKLRSENVKHRNTYSGDGKQHEKTGSIKLKTTTIAETDSPQSFISDMYKLPTTAAGKVKQPIAQSFPRTTTATSNIFLGDYVPGKRGPRKKFEPDENRPSMTIKDFLDEFVGDMSPPGYSSPPSPDSLEDPLARTRDASVQTDMPPEIVEFKPEPPQKTKKKALEAMKELLYLDVGNEVDVPVSENKTIDRSVWSQVNKEMALEKALIGLFNNCKAGEENAFSSFSDPSTIPEPQVDGTYNSHKYGTYDTANVIRSAAQLCEVNTVKVKQLEQLLQRDEETISALEDTIVKHLNAVMCYSGVELFRKCFDRVIKDAIDREKANEKIADVAVQMFDGKKKSQLQVPIYDPNLPTQYSEETKQMCKALMAYSGKAFVILKQIADLPQPQLVRCWSSYPDGSPGYSDQAFKMLRQYHYRTNKVKLCSLSVVDVPLQKDVVWDGKRSFGYEDLGFGYIDDDSIREASKAVVFYVKILTENKRLPVGYCLVDVVTPRVRANLINQYITHLDTVGVRCVAVVCDYSLTTYETFVELGALQEGDIGWFHHPLTKSVRVMCFTDIFQNVQALSNLWAEKKIFRPSPKAETAIDRDNITEGDAYLKAPSGYSSVPTIAKFLSELKSLKCQVQKDPLMTDKYNAVMLTILRDLGVKKFASTSQTIKYLESLTAVTDIFSSNHPFDITDRRPVNYSNCTKISSRLTCLSSYFGGLCYGNGTKILASNRKLPVLMLKVNLCSLRNLLRRIFYGEKNKNTKFYALSLSLKDVYAATATLCGGAKRLVSATEFKKAFKKSIDCYTWTPSERLTCDHVDKFPIADVCLGFNNAYSYEYAPFNSVSEGAMEFLTENVIETWLEKVRCVECSQMVQKGILTSRDYNLEGNIVRDIHKMIRTAESCLAAHVEIPCDSYDLWFSKFSNETLNSLMSVSGFKSCDHLFVSVPFGGISHFTVMVKDMLRIYLQLRLSFMNREERIKIQAPREHSMKFNLGRSWT